MEGGPINPLPEDHFMADHEVAVHSFRVEEEVIAVFKGFRVENFNTFFNDF